MKSLFRVLLVALFVIMAVLLLFGISDPIPDGARDAILFLILAMLVISDK